MAILGAHLSIAGGYHKAVEKAHLYGCDCLQVFTKNTTQWRARRITSEEATRFRAALAQSAVSYPIAHASYLINLASPDRTLWRRSIDAFVAELYRAAALGLLCVVLHPGAYTRSSHSRGLRRIIRALDAIHAQTPEVKVRCLLETTAGQGTSIGWRFEHLAAILDGVKDPDRLGICFDTCHVFAAGYPIGTNQDYRATMKALDEIVGLGRIKAFHLNDSRHGLGSRIDRHEHIGHGRLGLAPFRRLLHDRRFHKIPMYLETPKGRKGGLDWDVINLKTLRGL
jgi:deoxyribonuclease-4